MKILITGNYGYLGSILTKYLMQMGNTVHGLDNGMQLKTLSSEAVRPNVQMGSVIAIDDNKYDVVYHLAAISNDPMGDVNADLTWKTNTWMVRDICAKLPDARHVLASSASVYGAIPNTDVADELYKLNPLTEYARSKVAAEQVVSQHWDYSILRMGTLWGASPNFRRDIVVNAFFNEAIHTGKIMPKAEARRPMLHVSDAARTMILAGRSGLWGNRVVNVSAENTTVGEIAKKVAIATGAIVDWVDAKEPDKRDYAMDTKRFESISAELGRLVCVGSPQEMYDVKENVEGLGSKYPTRLEALREWLDKHPAG